MYSLLLNLFSMKLQTLMSEEDAQDLVEYALLVTLIALACVAGMGYIATAVNTAFQNISTQLA